MASIALHLTYALTCCASAYRKPCFVKTLHPTHQPTSSTSSTSSTCTKKRSHPPYPASHRYVARTPQTVASSESVGNTPAQPPPIQEKRVILWHGATMKIFKVVANREKKTKRRNQESLTQSSFHNKRCVMSPGSWRSDRSRISDSWGVAPLPSST